MKGPLNPAKRKKWLASPEKAWGEPDPTSPYHVVRPLTNKPEHTNPLLALAHAHGYELVDQSDGVLGTGFTMTFKKTWGMRT